MKPAEAYIFNQPHLYQSIILHLHQVIQQNVSDTELLFKWGIPYMYSGHSLLKISTTTRAIANRRSNSLMNHELKCVLMTRIITIAGIRDIQFQFR